MKLIQKKKQNNEGNIQNDSLKNKNAKLFEKKLLTLQKRKITSCFLKIFLIVCIIKTKTNSSSIHIIINKEGNSQIFSHSKCSENSFINPDKIYINGDEKTNIKNDYDLVDTINNITLFWNNEINSTACLFSGCKDISEIDLSDFNSSELMFIHGMFWNCESLTSINFMNFNTSKVLDMHFTFNNCQKLKDLNMSNFDTSSVTNMKSMFFDCFSLVSLNSYH